MLATVGMLSGNGEQQGPVSIILVDSLTGGVVGLSCFSLATSHCAAHCIWVLIVGTKLGGLAGLKGKYFCLECGDAVLRAELYHGISRRDEWRQ